MLTQIPLERVIYWAGVLGALQVVVFLWSVVANWPESQDYSASANADNLRLSSQWQALATLSLNPPADFDVKYAELKATDDCQIAHDTKRDITDAEKMRGTRAGLLQFERLCKVCKVVPAAMKMPFWFWKRCPRCGGEKVNALPENTPHS